MTPPSRAPRALSASQPLRRALALCDRALTSIPARGKRKARPTVSLAELTRLEDEIDARLHDDVLVLLSLGDPVAKLVTGIESMVSIAEAAEDFEAPDGYVRIAKVYSDPVGELTDGAHGAAYIDLLAPREPEGDEANVLVVVDDLVDDADETPLGEFIDTVIREALAGDTAALSILATHDAPALDPVPTLIAGATSKKKKPQSGVERVTHPKFGDGTVVSRSGEGDDAKVVVAFADRERTLLARFVTPAS